MWGSQVFRSALRVPLAGWIRQEGCNGTCDRGWFCAEGLRREAGAHSEDAMMKTSGQINVLYDVDGRTPSKENIQEDRTGGADSTSRYMISPASSPSVAYIQSTGPIMKNQKPGPA